MADKKTFKIFVVNPGSTSTKVELFEDERSILEANVFHDSTILRTFATINDQLDYRMETVRGWLRENGVDLSGVDAIVGRGGACFPLEGGTYEVDERLLDDIRAARGGIYHSSMLGVQMAKALQAEFGGRLFTVDPIMVDEYQDVARVTGVAGIWRTSATHALNQKATARRHARTLGRRYEDLNLIVCHIDGGITIMAHRHGRMVDGNNGSGGDGPFSPTRMGTMAITDFINQLFHRPEDEVRKLCLATGGLSSWFGTSNSDVIHARVEAGDPKATLVWQTMIYQITKHIGAMAAVLHGQVDGIVLTGGLMRFADIYEGIREACSWIAPVASYPGELEHEAMRDGALRVLRGEEPAKKYTGKPVFDGFSF
ncbi:MAG: butyrate kinase [Kiritimatiellae bacterium]|nr:butyrate kinase [Kiritimatiellia bacterium]MBP5786791.1 butyrate kinase [Kiritimatiellia bacterium]